MPPSKSAQDAAASTPSSVRAVVHVENGFYQGLAWPLERSTTVIGRGSNADLVLNEATISRAHALIGYDGDRIFVQDLGSTNGTLVNGRKEERKYLDDSDELMMGRLVLRIAIERGAAKRAGKGSARV
ncbi:MAG: FHA domain-containing protein [Myxococcota bacterium]